MGEESTHPLLVAEEAVRGSPDPCDAVRSPDPCDHALFVFQVHTYVNTTGLLEEQPSPLTVTTPLESPASPLARCPPTPPPPPRVGAEPQAPPTELEPQVLVELRGVRFVLGPTPVQKKRQQELQDAADPQETDSPAQTPAEAEPPPTHSDSSSSSNPSMAPRRHRPPPLTPDVQNVNNSAQRRTALLDYENLPVLPPVWEARKPSGEEEGNADDGLKTPSLNGFEPHTPYTALPHPTNLSLCEPSHNYVNTENVTAPLSAHRPDTARRRTDGPTIFNFDFRRPPLPGGAEAPKILNYIEVEMDRSGGTKGASDGSNPHTPRTPTSPLPPTTPTRRTEPYALIDIERTAAMSSLQKARPRDDGTSRKTRHNSTELPSKSAA